jgi:predicted HicB family RNase H-like nuclease
MNAIIYKNYTARIEFDGRDNIFVGRIAGIRDRVSFHADTVKKLNIAFKEAVEDYIETCAKAGKSPEKPASGKLMLRVPPEVHGSALIAAQVAGKSLNQWATEVLREAAHA